MKSIVILAAIVAVSLPVGALAYRTAPMLQPARVILAGSSTWRIVQYYKGDAFVLDHGLTHDDCDDMLPRNQRAKGLSFACELEA